MERKRITRTAWLAGAILAVAVALLSQPVAAQQPYPGQPPYPQQPPPYYGQAPVFYPDQLDSLVGRIALYPDPLLAHVLTASTYPDQIQPAAEWADAHRYLSGDALARAIYDDHLPWDPSVLAIVPFPGVLDMMARDPGWTQQLGSAVLSQRPAVMDAIQRMRQRAADYGYLQSTPQERVVMAGPGNIEIVPVDPTYLYVPVYNPAVVFVRPARGVFVGSVISFGPRIFVGAAFAPYGWAGSRLDWRARTVIIDHRPWERTWTSREHYVHPYAAPPPRVAGPRVEHHEREVHEHRGQEHGHERER
jgi:hypothetical protein